MLDCRDINADRVMAVLSFERGQLLYDIRNLAYVEGDIMGEDAQHARHVLQDVGEEGNVDRVTRVLDLAVARCRELLYPYTKREIDRPALDNRLRERPVYGIALNLPSGFSQTSLTLLERLVHEYLVCKALADWLSIINPAKAQVWEAKAEDALTEIRSSLNARIARVRRRPHPF